MKLTEDDIEYIKQRKQFDLIKKIILENTNNNWCKICHDSIWSRKRKEINKGMGHLVENHRDFLYSLFSYDILKIFLIKNGMEKLTDTLLLKARFGWK